MTAYLQARGPTCEGISDLSALTPALEHGWHLLPCAERAKTPLISDWPRRASCDVGMIRTWAQKYERCNWAVATGPESGIFVVDVDGEAGENSFCSLVDRHGIWEKTLAVITARGRHFYFAWPTTETIRSSAGKLGAGIDVRGSRGFAIIPPSVHPTGVSYEWAADFQVASAPDWLLESMTRAARPVLDPRQFGILTVGGRNDGLTRLGGSYAERGEIDKRSSLSCSRPTDAVAILRYRKTK